MNPIKTKLELENFKAKFKHKRLQNHRSY